MDFISEGATMACEAGILGTPYLYMNPLSVGYINTQVKNYKHASQCVDEDIILNVIDQNLQTNFNELQRSQLVKEIESTTIDPTLMLENIISK